MIELSYVSLFSGIEAFSVAASRVEGVRWNPVFFSEIDPFPCAVLAHHFPQVPNLGDICKIRVDREKGVITNGTTTVALPGAGIDILAGGSPCQDCSIAGKRAGMAEGSGTRSSLAFEYARLVEELRPRIILWENVGGVLSSNRGLDFAAFLRSLVERGYSLAYRVLDAQYTVVDGFPRAVPQRRKRVWLVGCAGTDESVPAQILFEFPRLLGDTPPRRQAGQGFACPVGYCASGDDRVVGGTGRRPAVAADATSAGTDVGTDGGNRVGDAGGGRGDDAGEGAGTVGSLEVAAPPCAADGKGKNGMDICGKVAVQAQGDVALGFDARNTGLYGAGATGVEVGMTQDANQYKGGKAVVQAIGLGHGNQGGNGAPAEECCPTLTRDDYKGPLPAVAAQVVNCLTPGHPQMHRVYTTDGVAPTLDAHNGAGQNQQAVLVTAFKLDSTASNSMKSANPHSGFHETQVAACLDTTSPDPSKNQGGNVIVSTNSNGEDVAPTLDTKTGALTGINGNNDTRGGYVIATNSNGEDVMPPITASEYKGAQAQKDKGGYCIVHELRDVRHGGGSLGVPIGPEGEGHDGCEGE